MAGGFIPPEVIEEIKTRTDIVSLVEQYVVLSKKSSKNYFGLCPFHHEDTPSFSVSPGKQIYYCFGCHKGGDAINFLKDIENLAYPEAVRMLGERAGITVDVRQDADYEKRRDFTRRLEDLNTEAARFFYHTLISPEGQPARDYLRRRGLSERTARAFGLGYAGSAWEGLYQHLRQKGFREEELRESGLFRDSKFGKTADLFRERLMFPIISATGKGKIVAFGGRILDDGIPKYINSPETPIYTKGRHLYGLNLAKRSQDSRIILVEGYMDCIALHQGGIDNACAVLGTALTDQQARLLRQQTEHVVLSLDADRAGQAATLRALEILMKEGIKVTVLQIPGSKDPDQYIRDNGAERFRALVDEALPVYDYRLEVARKKANEAGSLNIAVLQDEVCQVLESIDNNILFEVYLGKSASILGIQVEAVRQELARRARLRTRQGDNTRAAVRPAQVAGEGRGDHQASDSALTDIYLTRDEAFLLILLAQHSDVYDKMLRKPAREDFLAGSPDEKGPGSDWLDRILSLAAGGGLTPSRLLSESVELSLHGKSLSDVLAETLMSLPEQQTLPQLLEEAARYEKAVRLDSLTRQRTRLLTRIGSPGLEADVVRILRSRYSEVEQEIQELRSS